MLSRESWPTFPCLGHIRLCVPLHHKKDHKLRVMGVTLCLTLPPALYQSLFSFPLLQEQVPRSISHRPCSVYVVQTEEVVIITREDLCENLV